MSVELSRYRVSDRPNPASPIITAPGMIGKNHLAVALGYAACLRGHSVLFAAAIDMVNRLSAAESNRQLARKIKRYQSPKNLID